MLQKIDYNKDKYNYRETIMGQLDKSINEPNLSEEEQERRDETDRRAELSPTNFPVYTETGSWVRKERRKKPERRIQNICVAENQLLEEEFMHLFKEYS